MTTTPLLIGEWMAADDRPRERGEVTLWRVGWMRWRFRVYTGARSWLSGRAPFRLLIPGRANRLLENHPNRKDRRAMEKLARERADRW